MHEHLSTKLKMAMQMQQVQVEHYKQCAKQPEGTRANYVWELLALACGLQQHSAKLVATVNDEERNEKLVEMFQEF